MNQLEKMYQKIRPDEEAVNRCIAVAKGRRARVRRWPRVLAAAACVTLVAAAVMIPIAAGGGAFDILRDYDTAIQQEQRAGDTGSGAISSASLHRESNNSAYFESLSRYAGAFSTDDMAMVKNNVSITPQSVYYDGESLIIGLIGSYEGDETCERLQYMPADGDEPAFLVEGEAVSPTYGDFYLVKQDGVMVGALALHYKSDKTHLSVQISVPRLQCMNAAGDVAFNDPIPGPFTCSLEVYRTYHDNLTYSTDGADDGDIYIRAVNATPAQLSISYFVNTAVYPESGDSNIRYNMQVLPVTEDGSSPDFVRGYETKTDDGVIKTAEFMAVSSDRLTLIVYDKNNTDGCDRDICEKARFTVTLTK